MAVEGEGGPKAEGEGGVEDVGTRVLLLFLVPGGPRLAGEAVKVDGGAPRLVLAVLVLGFAVAEPPSSLFELDNASELELPLVL
jgi:hypothetical protein